MAKKEDVGTTKNCFTCGNEMECKESEYEGKKSYSWYDPDSDNKHYSYDYQTSKVTCKHAPETEDENSPDYDPHKEASRETKQTTNSGIPVITLPKLANNIDQGILDKAVKEGTEMGLRELAIYSGVITSCVKVGLTNIQAIGMIYKQASDKSD